MVLEGVVTNVTDFGAFVDVGVHQDGLVHISMLADRFVKDPHEVVQVGAAGQGEGAGGGCAAQADRAEHASGMRVQTGDRRNEASSARGRSGGRNRHPDGDGGHRSAKEQRGQQGARRQREPAAPASPPAAGTMADAFAKARRR